MADTVALLIRGRQIRLAALLETREAIEPFCAQLAAQHHTDEDLAILDAANDALTDADDDLDAFLQANIDWHIAVAAASHNELLSGLMNALSRAIFAATANEEFVDRKVREITVRAHHSVTNAIRESNPEAAVRRMTRHVHSYAESALAFDRRTEIPLDEQG
jgi:DNA-binding FadR family transcriptional regulator